MLSLICLVAAPLEIQLSRETLHQGEICYLSVQTSEQGLLSLEYRGEPYPLIPWDDGFVSLIGTSYKTSPGRKSIRITFSQGWNTEILDTAIRVVPSEFRKSVITLPRSKQGTIDTTRQRRKAEEYEAVVEAINAPSGEYYSIFPEIFPCPKKISGTYGDERWIGGHKAWHHAGLDFAVPSGTPILAPCPGKVVMARDTFIRQGTFVILDHGAGLKTLYYHMIERNVEEGEVVQTGDTLGFVGSTGLATGPHLHMGIYINGIAVDPLFWLERKEPF
ncbi:M23 family metallopeptidase [candidate division WOR-3 bacterium]|nr:M23 family metallopeptidase [candidate division WOR-3 bacterium]